MSTVTVCCGSVVKNPAANAGDARNMGLILGSRKSPGVGNGTPEFLPGKFHGQRPGGLQRVEHD